MVDIDKIEKKDEEKILELYHEYRKSKLEKKADERLLDEMNSIFVQLFGHTYA